MTRILFRIFLILGLIILIVSYFAIERYKDRKLSRLYPPYSTKHNHQIKEGVDLLIFGDSRASMWNTALFENLDNVANAGIGGDVTINMLHRLKKDVLDFSPKSVVLVAGINDIVIGSLLETEKSRQQNLDSTVSNLKEIVHMMEQADIQVVVLTITPPLKPDLFRQFIWGDEIDRDVSKVNKAIRALEQKNVKVLDVMPLFESAGNNWVEMVRSDALHYTPAAYRLLSKKISSFIKEFM